MSEGESESESEARRGDTRQDEARPREDTDVDEETGEEGPGG